MAKAVPIKVTAGNNANPNRARAARGALLLWYCDHDNFEVRFVNKYPTRKKSYKSRGRYVIARVKRRADKDKYPYKLKVGQNPSSDPDIIVF
ncbi:MAG: hypothetical protein ACE5PT_02815 [Gemmatimonadales bacterium]